MNKKSFSAAYEGWSQDRACNKIKFSTRLLLALMGILFGIAGIIAEKYYGNWSLVIDYKETLFAVIAGASFALLWFTNRAFRVFAYASLMTYCGFCAWEISSPYAASVNTALQSFIAAF